MVRAIRSTPPTDAPTETPITGNEAGGERVGGGIAACCSYINH